MLKVIKTTAPLALLAAFLIAVPSATARPIDYPSPGSPDTVAQSLPAGINGGFGPNFVAGPPEIAQTATGDDASSGKVASSGFDWGDAGIGAAAMLSLVGLGTGAALVARRNREPARPAIG
jgi:hypothetical protein